MNSIRETRTRDVYRKAVRSKQNCTHFLAALIFAQRALCAAAILLRPEAEMVLLFRPDFPARR